MHLPVKFYRKRARRCSDMERQAGSNTASTAMNMYMVMDHRRAPGDRFSVVAHLWEHRIGRRRDNRFRNHALWHGCLIQTRLPVTHLLCNMTLSDTTRWKGDMGPTVTQRQVQQHSTEIEICFPPDTH
jgi:hypothetical protein